MSFDPAVLTDEFRQAQIDAAAELPGEISQLHGELREALAPFDAFDVLGNLWLLNVPKSPETYREWEDEGVLAIVEIAAAVMVERESRAGAEPNRPLSGEVLMDAQAKAKSLLTLEALTRMIATSGAANTPEPYEEIRARAIAHRVGVRGPSYAWQERATFLDLFDDKLIRSDVETACGVSARTAITLTEAIDRIGLQQLGGKTERARKKADELIAEHALFRAGKPPRDARWTPALERLADLPPEDVELQIHAIAIAWAGFDLGTTLSFTAEDLAAAASCELAVTKRFLTMFATEFGAFRDLGRPVGTENIRDRPLLVDANGRYLSISPHNLHWGLRPRFEQSLKDAGPAVFGRYERHRSKTVELRAIEALTKALKPDWAHQDLRYDVEDGGSSKRAELDGLVRHDSALMIVEAKASSMRASARRVAPKSFKEWLEDEVSAAANQARRAREALLEAGSPVFDESGAQVEVDLSGIRHVFELVVVLEDLPAVGPATWLLADAGILPGDPIPWVVSLHELEIICDIVARPSELVHYLERRRRMDRQRDAWAVDELDYFMHYVMFGLYWPDLDETVPHLPEQLLSHTEQLDSWYMYEQGERKRPAAKPRRALHPSVETLLTCLDEHPAPGYLDSILPLLELAPKVARKITDLMAQLRRRSSLDKRWHDRTFPGAPFGITIMSCPPGDAAELPQRLLDYCRLKKHQLRADSWVGFGVWEGPPEPVQCACVFAEPWEEDPDLDALVATLPSAASPTGGFDGRPNARRRFPTAPLT